MCRHYSWMLAAILCCGSALTSCVGNDDNPATDCSEIANGQNIIEPSDFADNIDNSTYAGDDFYRYAVGQWQDSHPLKKGQLYTSPISEQSYLAGVFVADVARGKYNDAIVSRLRADYSPTTFEADKALLKSKLAQINQTATEEALYEVMGQLVSEGYQAPYAFSVSPAERKVTPMYFFYLSKKEYNLTGKALMTFADIPATDTLRILKVGDEWTTYLAENRIINYKNNGQRYNPHDGKRLHRHRFTRSMGSSILTAITNKLGIDTPEYVASEDVEKAESALASKSLQWLKDLLVYLVVERDSRFIPYIEPNARVDADMATDIIMQLINISYSPLATRVSQIYNDHQVPVQNRTEVQQMAEELRQAFKVRIDNNKWMGEATKAKVREKLDAMQFFIGWPERRNTAWEIPDQALDGQSNRSIYQDILELYRQSVSINKSMIGRTNRDDLFYAETCLSPAYVGNAFYSPWNNCVIIVSTNLVPPIYDPSRSPAYNWGQMGGSTIGHEMTHGFDSNGRAYDKTGKKADWWNPADKQTFESLKQKMIDRFEGMEYFPGYYCNGTNTLGENIADLGGLNIGYDAFMTRLSKEGVSGAELDRQSREYFRGYAYGWAEVFNAQYAESVYKNDVHAPCVLRTNGNVYLLDEFYRVFHVTSGRGYVAPMDRFVIW